MIPLSEAIIMTIISAAFTAGGFYVLTNYRLRRVENEIRSLSDNNQESRERLVRIETLLQDQKKTA